MKKKICFIVNTDWAFINFRLPIAQACLKKGYEVFVLTEITDQDIVLKLKNEGIIVRALDLKRKNSNPFHLLYIIFKISVFFIKIKPAIVHLITIKPVLLGGIASRIVGIDKVIVAITGLGSTFLGKGAWNKIRKYLVKKLYRISLGTNNLHAIFQNEDDKNEIKNIINLSNTYLIQGSGVDLDKFSYHEENLDQNPRVLMVARLIRDKGVIEFCEAAKELKEEGCKAEFCIVGALDPGNPSCINQEKLDAYSKNNQVIFKGFSENVLQELINCNLFVLPSYGEGFPKSIIEASAIGRAVITTDVSGCRDAVVDQMNGFIVKSKDIIELKTKIKFLLTNTEERKRMGKASRSIAEKNYSINKVVKSHLEIYKI
tara:strand:- start:1258 stop:2376 length:1119 start_codon:yes stop_codon:yes gene_type:complete